MSWDLPSTIQYPDVMDCLRWCSWIAATTALALFPISAVRAGHCDYCNDGLPSSVSVESTEIGVDGVIVLRLVDSRERVPEIEWWDIVTVTVTDADGAVVDGSLELHPGFSRVAWRPTNPWGAGSHEIAVDVNLEAFEDAASHGCAPYTHSTEVVVVDEPRHVVGPQELALTESYVFDPRRSLSTIVCCDGALPYLADVSGVLCPGHPETELRADHYCTEVSGHGSLRVQTELLVDGSVAHPDYALREVTRATTAPSGGGAMSLSLSQPECLEFEVLDLVTGELTVHPSCHGEAVADELGTLPIDPAAALAASCTDTPYICEVIGDRWDPSYCTSWPDGAEYEHPEAPPEHVPNDGDEYDDDPPFDNRDARGCHVAGGEASGAGLLLLIALLGLRRRRSPLPHSTTSATPPR